MRTLILKSVACVCYRWITLSHFKFRKAVFDLCL